MAPTDQEILRAFELAVQVATPIAREQEAIAANGEFLQFLMMLIKELLPLILSLF